VQVVHWALKVDLLPKVRSVFLDHFIIVQLLGWIPRVRMLIPRPNHSELNHIRVDSAQFYKNEAEAGAVINKFLSSPENTGFLNLTREDITFTSKLEENADYATARALIKKSVQRSGLGYIDLFLLHKPYGGPKARLESWRAVENAILEVEVELVASAALR